jgi:uncharacterized membrane protein
MERKSAGYLAACIFLAILYLVGRVGLVTENWQLLFQRLVPVNLIITAIVIFLFHKNWNSKFVISGIIIFAAGFIAEFFGVQSGLIFGEYNYGSSLGLKLWQIPLIIGLNWLVLIYCVNNILNWLKIKNHIIAAFIGGSLLVFLDYFLEPFAIKFDLWNWKSITIPPQNYVGWFILSALMILFFRNNNQVDKQVNFVAVFAFFLQLIFFASFMI